MFAVVSKHGYLSNYRHTRSCKACPCGRWKGRISILKTQDRFPITTVGNDQYREQWLPVFLTTHSLVNGLECSHTLTYSQRTQEYFDVKSKGWAEHEGIGFWKDLKRAFSWAKNSALKHWSYSMFQHGLSQPSHWKFATFPTPGLWRV